MKVDEMEEQRLDLVHGTTAGFYGEIFAWVLMFFSFRRVTTVCWTDRSTAWNGTEGGNVAFGT